MKDYSELVNRCIYCGIPETETKLKKEHIIPYSLYGNDVIQKASCQSCEAVTSSFEGRCIRTMYRLLRLRFGIRSRRKKRKALTLKAPVIINGSDCEIEMPVDGVIGLIGFIKLLPPGFQRSPRIVPKCFGGATLSMKNIGPRDKKVWKNLNVSNAGADLIFHVESYALMMAKIAHCQTVKSLGYENFEHTLPKYILRQQTKGLPYYVGGLQEDEPASSPEDTHEVKLSIFRIGIEQYYISVYVRLFAFLGGPTTEVIAGFLNESQFQNAVDRLTLN